ncbi:MAG: hypothetical protein ACI80L_001638 [Pseudohongiellaceae bacterium]|jgi:hypothetical protein
MLARLSGLNLSIRFLLLIYAASLHRRPYARKYVTHNGCWPLMTAGGYLPIIIDYCGVGQLSAVTNLTSQNSLLTPAISLVGSHFQGILLFRKMSLCQLYAHEQNFERLAKTLLQWFIE